MIHVAKTARVATVTCANPPTNLIVPETVQQLHDAVSALAKDGDIQVAIFDSKTDGFFYNHFDLRQAAQFPASSDVSRWTDLVLRLARAPFVTIAKVRGRTRGGGNELALACDLRYASRELASFGQPEVGTGIIPGGGGSERLPRAIGRDRSLEVILTSDDYDADTAERWGWVTRALLDADLDHFVGRLAMRLASFDKAAIAAAKAQIDRASLPPDGDLVAAYTEYTTSLKNPGLPARFARLGALVAAQGLDVELRLGHYLGVANEGP
jgi:enoyl-CoA hydratase/carnithine racemase